MTMLMVTNWNWAEILWVSLIGFLLVALLLIALVGVMKIFGLCFSVKRREDDPRPEATMISDEEVAAIATALQLYRGALHDQESAVLTILNIKRVYSPWNSKIHGLTQLPGRK